MKKHTRGTIKQEQAKTCSCAICGKIHRTIYENIKCHEKLKEKLRKLR